MVMIQLKGSDKESIFVANTTILEALQALAVLIDDQIDSSGSSLLELLVRLETFPPVDDKLPLVLISTPDKLDDPIATGSVAIRYRDTLTDYHTFQQIWTLFISEPQ